MQGASAADETITLSPALAGGDNTYNFYAQIEKTANATIKSACSTALSYVLDTTAPTVTFSGIDSGARISNNSSRTLIVTFNEDIKAGTEEVAKLVKGQRSPKMILIMPLLWALQ